MIDLTNKSIDEVNALIQKYSAVLELIKIQEYVPYLAVIIDTGINHIQENHKSLGVDWKAWSIIHLKYQFLTGGIKKYSDIPKLIDGFIKHYNEKYPDFINDTVVFSNEYERDFSFMWRYTQKNR
jgi:hypothetical protein